MFHKCFLFYNTASLTTHYIEQSWIVQLNIIRSLRRLVSSLHTLSLGLLCDFSVLA